MLAPRAPRATRCLLAAAAFLAALAPLACGPAPAPESPPKPPAPSATPPSAQAPAPRPPLAGQAIFYLDDESPDDGPDFAISPDGALLATDDRALGITLFGARDGKPRLTLETPGEPTAIGFRDDGAQVNAIAEMGAVAWDVKTGEPVFSVALAGLGHTGHAAFSPSGKWLAIADREGTLRVLDVATGALVSTTPIPPMSRVERWSPGSDRLLTRHGTETRAGSTQSVWEMPGGKPVCERSIHDVLSPDLRLAADIAETGVFRLFDAVSGAKLMEQNQGTYRLGLGAEITPTPVTVHAAAWSPDGARLVIQTDIPGSTQLLDSRARPLSRLAVIDVAARKSRPLSTKVGDYPPPSWSRDGKLLLATLPGARIEDDPRPIAIDATTGSALPKGASPCLDQENPADASHGVCVKIGESDRVLDGATGAPLWTIPHRRNPDPLGDTSDLPSDAAALLHGRSAGIGAISPHTMVLTGGTLQTDLFAFSLDRGQGDVSRTDLEQAPDLLAAGGQLIAALAQDKGSSALRLWSWQPGDSPTKLTARPNPRAPVAVSPDGALMACSAGKDVLVLDAKGKQLAKITNKDWSDGLMFDEKATLLAIESYGSVRTVSLPDAAPLAEITDGEHGARALRADGALVIHSKDAFKSYDPTTGKLLSTAAAKLWTKPVWSPDGRLAFSSGALWDTSTGARKASVDLDGTQPFFSADAKYLIAVLRTEGVALIFSTSDGKLARAPRVPVGSEALGAAADLVAVRTPTGALLFRPDTGASYRLDLLRDKDLSVVTSLATGHFEAPAAASPHVRLFVPGAKGPLVLHPGSAQDAFRRADLRLDFFPSP